MVIIYFVFFYNMDNIFPSFVATCEMKLPTQYKSAKMWCRNCGRMKVVNSTMLNLKYGGMAQCGWCGQHSFSKSKIL